jgi:putative ABC transport system permease protein
MAMSFLTLILKNLIRQRTRTALTVLGISIGITTVVALGVIADGLLAASEEVVHAAGADFMVGQKGASDLTFSTVTYEDWDALAARPDVERAVGALIAVKRVGNQPYFVIIGVEPEQLATVPLAVQTGDRIDIGAADQVMLGDRAARELKVAIGDTVTLAGRTFQVVGTYHSGSTWQDAGAYAPLATVQEIAGRRGVVTVVYVTATSGLDAANVAAAIERDHPQLTAILTADDYSEIDQGIQAIDAANLAISLLAVGIGAIGVMNTMIMAVYERTREIGILRAVGWRGSRILRLVIGESIALCFVAAVVGTLLGVLTSRAVLLVPAIRNLIRPQYSAEIFARALVVAIIVALAGAAYPAFRAVRLTPLEALRHE